MILKVFSNLDDVLKCCFPAVITSLTTYLVDEGTAVAFLVLQAGCMISTGVLLPRAGLTTPVSHPELVAGRLEEGGAGRVRLGCSTR